MSSVQPGQPGRPAGRPPSMNGAGNFAERRGRMVVEQLAERGIQDTRVLAAMGRLPGERFVPADMQHLAYADCALPIAENQTISQPYMAGVMAEALRLRGHEQV